jgi:methionyl-tRNA formyltransferase
VRAFDPAPGATAKLRGETIKVWLARAQPDQALPAGRSVSAPGTVLAVSDQGIEVATGNGTLVLQELQRPGGKRMAVADFLRGFEVNTGMQFDTAGGED